MSMFGTFKHSHDGGKTWHGPHEHWSDEDTPPDDPWTGPQPDPRPRYHHEDAHE